MKQLSCIGFLCLTLIGCSLDRVFLECRAKGGLVLKAEPAVCFGETDVVFAKAKDNVEPITQPFFQIAGSIVTVHGQDVQLYSYSTTAALKADTRKIARDGNTVDDIIVMWGGAPHFFQRGKVMALYIGRDPVVLEELTRVFGDQFAGSQLGIEEDKREPLQLTVQLPEPDSEATYPLKVRGVANRRALRLLLRDDANTILAEKKIEVTPTGIFNVEMTYPISQTKFGTLIVKELETADSAPGNVHVPLRFPAIAFEEVKIFFSNVQRDPGMTECGEVYAVERQIPKTESLARVTVEHLLQGPLPEERQAGFMTSIDPSTQLKRVSIQNGVAVVEFNDMLDKDVAGSCLTQAIRSQIERTLLQFSSVRSVVILVEGKPREEVLQP